MPPSPPRTFVPADLHRITTADYEAMSPEDQRAYSEFILDQWSRTDEAYLDGDYERVDSRTKAELGE